MSEKNRPFAVQRTAPIEAAFWPSRRENGLPDVGIQRNWVDAEGKRRSSAVYSTWDLPHVAVAAGLAFARVMLREYAGIDTFQVNAPKPVAKAASLNGPVFEEEFPEDIS